MAAPLVRAGVRALALGVVVAIASCKDGGAGKPGASAAATGTTTGTLASALVASANKASVPRDLLVAIAQVEDGLRVPRERLTVRVDEDVPAAGPLQLRRGKLDTLKRGAELAQVPEIELRKHADLALEAGALVLAELGAQSSAVAGDLASWNAAIEEMSGFADDAHRTHYAHQVFATLARGGSFPARDGEIVVLPPHDLPPSLTLEVSLGLQSLAVAQYPDAEWIPTSCKNKCDPTRDGKSVELVIIHDTEGNWAASVATLQNDPEKSVQYIVGTDGHVAQFVTEETTAWHCGNLNYNQRSVGIEHVGWDDQPFTEAQYAASAKLVDYLATKYAVPRDRAHIIGHDQVPNGSKIGQTADPCLDAPAACEASDDWGGANNHRDPGIWEWATYMPRFDGTAKCDDVTASWACSNDRTKRVRCAGGVVATEACSCAGAMSGGGDGGAGGSASDGGGGDATCVATQSAPPIGGGATPAAGAQAAPATPEASGCAVSRAGAGAVSNGGAGAAGTLLGGLFLACMRARGRDRRRQSRRANRGRRDA